MYTLLGESLATMVIYIFRIVILGLCFLLAAIALGLAAQIINITFNDYNVYAGADLNFLLYRGTGPVLAIAIAAITTLTLPILLVVDLLRTGAFTSKVVVELAWLSVLWVLWLAAAIYLTLNSNKLYCEVTFYSIYYPYQYDVMICDKRLFVGVQAIAYTIAFLLLSYSTVILRVTMVGAALGHKTWTSSVKHFNFLGSNDEAALEASPVGAEFSYQHDGTPHQPLSQEAAVQGYPMLPEPQGPQSPSFQDIQVPNQAVVYV